MRTLTLTQDQFDALYDLLEETILDIQSHLDEDIGDVTLDDYEIYHVWKQLDRTISEPKVTITDDNYSDKVDTLVSNMVASNDNEFTHDSEGC